MISGIFLYHNMSKIVFFLRNACFLMRISITTFRKAIRMGSFPIQRQGNKGMKNVLLLCSQETGYIKANLMHHEARALETE
jgi:hypothetical protein